MADPGDPFEGYVATVGERLRDRGYGELPAAPEDYRSVAFGKRRFSIRAPGVVDTVFVLARFGDPSVRTVAEFSSRAFAFGLGHASRLPRGLGSWPVVYPVAACLDPSAALGRWVSEYAPSHRGATEFPVVVDLAGETVHYYGDTPLLGGSRYERCRKSASAFLDPSTADLDLEGL